MTAKEYLSQYRLLNARIDAKLAQVEKLRERAQAVGCGSASGVHSGAPYDRIGELTAKIVDREREINRDIDALVDIQRDIERRIALVEDDRLRFLLELRYINCKTFEQIACDMDYSYMQVCRLHGKALLVFSEKM